MRKPITYFMCGYLCILICSILILKQIHTTQAFKGDSEMTLVRNFKAHAATLSAICFSPDGKQLITGSQAGSEKIWDTTDWHLIRSLHDVPHAFHSFALSSDGKMLAALGWYDPIRIWNPATGRLIRSLQTPRDQGLLSAAFSPDGKLLAEGGDQGKILLWDTSTWKVVRTLNETLYDRGYISFSPVWDLAFSPNGRFLASTGGDGTSRIYDAKTWAVLPYGHGKRCQSVAFSPDSQFLATASDTGPVDVWDTGTGRKTPARIFYFLGAFEVSFSSDGKLLASAGYGGIKLSETKTWRLMKKAEYSGWIRSLCYSPRGNLLAAGDDDGRLMVWRIHLTNGLGR